MIVVFACIIQLFKFNLSLCIIVDVFIRKIIEIYVPAFMVLYLYCIRFIFYRKPDYCMTNYCILMYVSLLEFHIGYVILKYTE